MSARPIQPLELLDLADRLAGRGAGAGRPRTIELRRAVSSAYYAVFHELAWRGTAALLGPSRPGWTSTQAAVSRWIDHGQLRSLCSAATGTGTATLVEVLGQAHVDVVRIADAFLTLQDARHRADYDDTFDLTRANALGLIDSARDAVITSDVLAARGDATYALFLRLMLGAAQAKKRSN